MSCEPIDPHAYKRLGIMCMNVIVDNVDKMIRTQGIEGKNPGDIGKIMIGGKCCKISYVNIKIHIPKKQVCQLECG